MSWSSRRSVGVWSDVKTFADVTAVGKNYLLKKVKDSPWSGPSANLYAETSAPAILKPLLALHEHGVLTIDSQAAASKGPYLQKSYVQGFVDRRYAPALARELHKVPGTIVYVYDYKSSKKMGNFKPLPAKKPVSEYYVLTKAAQPPHARVTTNAALDAKIAKMQLQVIKDIGPLHTILKNQSAFLYVYNGGYGAKPEASEKILRIMKRLTATATATPGHSHSHSASASASASASSAKNANKFVSMLMNSRTQAHKFHLSTTSYAQHKALQTYYEDIVNLLDEYAEAYMGKYGRRMNGLQLNSRFMKDPEKARAYFKALLARIQKLNLPTDTYLRNIQDEILKLIQKTLYMLSLK